MSKYFFTDLGQEPGVEFCRHLLATGEWNSQMLREAGGSGGDKPALATSLAEMVIDGTIDPKHVLRVYCRRPRQWLTMRIGNAPVSPSFREPDGFFRELGKNDWYGPIEDVERKTAWYVRVQLVKHNIKVSSDDQDSSKDTWVTRAVRWQVIVEQTAGYVALHWYNFTRVDKIDAGDNYRNVQFPYWRYIPQFVEEFCDAAKTVLYYPKLQTIILEDMLKEYEDQPGFNWHHERIRAENHGVAVNARGAKIDSVNINGIRRLTAALAKAALDSVAKVAKEDLRAAERAILRTLLHEWGTKSYECRVEQDDKVPVFRAHCYFGALDTVAGDNGPDGFPHLKCFGRYGGSAAVRDLILRYVG